MSSGLHLHGMYFFHNRLDHRGCIFVLILFFQIKSYNILISIYMYIYMYIVHIIIIYTHNERPGWMPISIVQATTVGAMPLP